MPPGVTQHPPLLSTAGQASSATHRLQHSHGCRRLVEHIEVQAGNAGIDQLLHLPRGVRDADGKLGFFVIARAG